MIKKNIFLLFIFFCSLFLIWRFTSCEDNSKLPNDRIKVSLREVGNQLLLADKDSISLILPIILEKYIYKISFENQLSIEPKKLVGIIENNFQKIKIPPYYLVEVKHCNNQEVIYSYEMIGKQENSIIPCFGRVLPKSCYTIEIKFQNQKRFINLRAFLYSIILILFPWLIYLFNKNKKTNKNTLEKNINSHSTIGNFKFYPEQNKLVKDPHEISLSKKECELLIIFVSKPNQIIKREELTKKVWEDKGVIVGRSLDTYISKLRKKLHTDNSISLVNIHGIGYKLEIKK